MECEQKCAIDEYIERKKIVSLKKREIDVALGLLHRLFF